ncbi:MAG TPA: DUF2459 domain-containing protein [Steroidobacteraceae bacterium]|jgi:hypothetical protein
MLLLLCALSSAVQASTLYVARRSWHIDVGLAVGDLDAPLSKVAARFPAARFIFFGFGDRRYLLARHHGPSTLSGSIWPGAGLFLVTALDNSPEAAFGASHVERIELSEPQRRALVQAISSAFETDPPTFIKPGPYEESLYIAASPRYSGFHTCNTWAAEVMRQSGLSISSRGVIFAGQLWSRVKRLRAESAAP